MSNKNKDGIMYVTLSSYLRRLRAIERRKPEEERRAVPSMKKLAHAVGVHPSLISRMVYGHTRSLNIDVCASIISEMRRRGFQTEITDILKFEMEELKGPPIRTDDPWAVSVPPPPLTRRQHQEYPGEEFVKAYAESESTAKEE